VRKLTILIAALLLVLAGCGDEKKDERSSAGDSPETAAAPTTTETAPEAANGCETVEEPPAKQDGGQKRPKEELDPSETYRLKVDTTCGAFTVELDPEAAPKATASLVSLADAKFFDGTTFHRIVPDFVIQGGDPTGTGTGGPGYSTRDKPPADASYTKGVVAMAKAGNEPPGTAGSQFYVVTGEDAGLPPEYAVVGKVVEGQAVVDRIGQLGGPGEQPTQPVVIKTVRLEEG
jgi:cyclophilin family peptidyl-prolyl cis-trans isomerase